ncbi:hypothetical protein FSP39_023378 [Pinctada imbricata]|uniref:AAA+ ATPase domain-containing protein n=1 Tax=Pinctada imbricata TaxID=66713 RepID=A0AA88XUB6_PINIB|nr:hypothetical protein FSP39_023378 [Pinctada imbricata]
MEFQERPLEMGEKRSAICLSCRIRKAHPRGLVSGQGTRQASFPDQKPDPSVGLFSSRQHMVDSYSLTPMGEIAKIGFSGFSEQDSNNLLSSLVNGGSYIVQDFWFSLKVARGFAVVICSCADLAVHKKKIEEVESWLRTHLSPDVKRPGILLLTGPTGAGKTATLRVLARELKYDINEWANPDVKRQYNEWNQTGGVFTSGSEYSRVGTVSDSQIARFQQYLLSAYKYNTLSIFGSEVEKKKIILVEDIPNIFGRDPSSFHGILRKYSQTGRCPIVFVLSDGATGEFNKNVLFPKELEHQINITNISFNPVASTSMNKVLNKVVATELALKTSNFHPPSKSVVESISMSSAGDIRAAINALQFACLKDSSDLVIKPKSKVKAKRQKQDTKGKAKPTDDGELASIGGKDTSLFLFRALGKILYCKRDDPSNHTDLPKLPSHLQDHERDPLLINPEDVIEKCNISGEYFVAYLHQNYLDFYSTIEDIVRASQYISDSDFLSRDWNSRSRLQQVGASVSTRGLIHSNSARARFTSSGTGLGWKPLHKPQWYTLCKQRRESFDVSRSLYKDFTQHVILHTEILPYSMSLNVTSLSLSKRNFVRQICRFTHTTSSRSERLDDNAVDEDDSSQRLEETDDSSNTRDKFVLDSESSNTGTEVIVENDEEEYNIEEYND